MNIGELLASIGADIGPLKKAVEEAEAEVQGASKKMATSMEKFNQSMKSAGKQMKKVGKSMSLYITAPLTAIGAGAFKMQKDFEASMSKIVGLVGIAKDQVDAWGQDILKLAPKLGKAPQELADAMFVITSAGLRGQAALDALTISAKASTAGLGETKDIARAVAGSVNAYGAEVLDAAKANDVIVATARAGNFETSQFAAAIGRVLPFAKQAGSSFEDMGGAVALLTRTNGDAAQSITQMSALFRAFVVPTEEAKKILGEAGLSAQDMRDHIAKNGLVDALKMLDGTLDGNREELGRLLGSSEAASAAFQILGADAQTINDTFGVVNKSMGMTDEAFKAAAETTEFEWNKALSNSQASLISIGNTLKVAFLPMLRKASEFLQTVTDWFGSLTDSQKKWVIGISGAVAAIGPLLGILGTLTSTVIPAMVAGGASLATAWAPITAVVLGAYGAYRLFNIEASKTAKMADQMSHLSAEQLIRYQKGLVEELKQSVDDPSFGQALVESFQTAVDAGGVGIGALLDKARKAVNLTSKEEDLLIELEAVQIALKDQLEEEKQITEQKKEQEALLKSVQDAIEQGVQPTEQISTSIKKATFSLEEMQKSWESFDWGFPEESGFDFTGPDLGNMDIPQITNDLDGVASVMSRYAESMRQAEVYNSLFGDSLQYTQDQYNAIGQTINGLVEQGVSQYDPMLQTLRDRFIELGETINGNTQSMLDWKQISVDAANSVGQSMLQMAMNGKISTSEIIKQLLAQITARLITSIVSNPAIPFPFNLVLAGGAGALAGTLISQIPAFAEGGIVSAPTLGLVGEYPGARSNPEVIAPLNKLQGMMEKSNSSPKFSISHKIEGKDLYIMIEEVAEQFNRNFTRKR